MTEEITGTRKELAEQLTAEREEKAKLEARLARLEAAFAANQETDEQRQQRERRLAEAEAELVALRPDASRAYQPPSGPAPKLIPYKGWVRARVDCAYDAYYKPGDIFEVELQTLWSDDPWEAVSPRWDEGGALIEVKVRTDVHPVDRRFRQRAPDFGSIAANQI
jgi:hypothetical protein